MKKGITCILICAYLSAAFHFTVPYLSYYANFTYFAKEACVNKDNPEINCNGKCQLKKMVKQQRNHHQSEPDNAIQIVKVSSSTIFYFEVVTNTTVTLDANIFYRKALTDFHSQFIAIPPTPPPKLG